MSWWKMRMSTARRAVKMRKSFASIPTPESFSSGERPTMPAMVGGMPTVLFFIFMIPQWPLQEMFKNLTSSKQPMEEVEARVVKDLSKLGLKAPALVVGFPSTGLVGSVSLSVLAKQGFEFLGSVVSTKLAPIAAIHEGRPLPPIRILYSKEHNTILFLSEISVPISLTHRLAHLIEELYRKAGASAIYVVGGIFTGSGEGLYYVASTKKMEEVAKKKRLGKPIREGALTGVSGVLMYSAALKGIDALAILAEADPDKVDGKAAVKALQALSKVLSIKVDVKDIERAVEEDSIPAPSGGSMYR